MNLEYWIFKRFLPQNVRCRSPKTILNYWIAFNDFARFIERPPLVSDLTDETIAAFMNWMNGPARGVCARSCNERAGRLKTFWRWAASRPQPELGRKLIDTWPTVGNFPVAVRQPRAWTENEMVRLFNACRQQRGLIGDIPAWRFFMTIYQFWWNAPERTTATFLLPVTALELDRALAIVPAEIRKGRFEVVWRLWPDTVEMLRMILPPHTKPRELVFGAMKLGTFYKRVDRMMVRASLPHDRYSKPHRMRVSHATWTEYNGGDAARALRHRDNRTKHRYIDPSLLKQDETKLFRPW